MISKYLLLSFGVFNGKLKQVDNFDIWIRLLNREHHQLGLGEPPKPEGENTVESNAFS